MMRMKIMLNEERAKEIDKYTIDEMYEKIDNLANEVNINIKEGKNIYVGNGDRYDFARFGRMIMALGECDWYKKCVEEWLWYDDNEIDNVMELYNIRRDVV